MDIKVNWESDMSVDDIRGALPDDADVRSGDGDDGGDRENLAPAVVSWATVIGAGVGAVSLVVAIIALVKDKKKTGTVFVEGGSSYPIEDCSNANVQTIVKEAEAKGKKVQISCN